MSSPLDWFKAGLEGLKLLGKLVPKLKKRPKPGPEVEPLGPHSPSSKK